MGPFINYVTIEGSGGSGHLDTLT